MKFSKFLHSSGLFLLPSILAATTFSGWQAANFTPAQLTSPATGGATGDPDVDGVVNLHEYAFLGRPWVSDSNLSPTVQVVSGRLTLTYRERHDLSDISIRLQGSDTLFNWITYNVVTEADRETFTDYDEVTLIDPEPFTQDRRFLRLQVELLPIPEPRPPVQLSLNVITPTNWALAWTDPNITETGYAIERLLPTHVWARLATLGADTGDWQHASANYQTAMTYRVVAIGVDNREVPSEPVTLLDSDADGIPDALELGSSYTGTSGTFASKPDVYSSGGSGVSDGWLAANGFDPATHDTSLDTDGDGLSDSEEAARGTDPRSTDTDSDGVSDSEDAWPQHDWITSPRLPDVRYAVVRLRSLGWPTNRVALALDDQGGVLGATPNVATPFYFRPAIDPATGGNAVPINSAGGADNASLSKDGLISARVPMTPPPYWYKAETWRSGDTAATTYETQETFSGLTTNGIQTAITCSANGRIVVIEQGELYGTAPSRGGKYASVRIYTDGTSSLVGQRVERIFSGTTSTTTGTSFAPVLINNDGLLVGYPFGPGDLGNLDGTGPLSLWENGVISNLEGGAWALPNSTPRVFIGATSMDEYDIDNLRVYWTHKKEGVWVREDLQAWDPLTYRNDYPWPDGLRANDRLEMVASGELIRNGQFVPSAFYTPAGWADVVCSDINNHGIILAHVSRTLDDQGQPISDPQSEPVLLVPLSLTMDTNRDGLVDDADNISAKASITAKLGALVAPNIDANEAPADENTHATEDSIQFNDDGSTTLPANRAAIGPNDDVKDIARLRIGKTLVKFGGASTGGLRLVLKVKDAADLPALRIFRKRLAGEAPILGPGSPIPDATQIDITDLFDATDPEKLPLNHDVEFGVELLYFAGMALPGGTIFDGEVDLQIGLASGETFTAYDTVRFRAAPWLLSSNRDSAQKVFVTDIAVSPGDNLSSALNAHLPAGMTQVAPHSLLESLGPQWTQDHVEIGYTQMPGGPQTHATLRMPYGYNGGQPLWPKKRLLGTDHGVFQLGMDLGGAGGDFGGNLELLPPSSEWPLGRIVHGDSMGAKLLAFLNAQRLVPTGALQQPIPVIPTQWLRVGHVDEIFGFTGRQSEEGAHVVAVASPQVAYTAMEAIPIEKRGAAVFFIKGANVGTKTGAVTQLDTSNPSFPVLVTDLEISDNFPVQPERTLLNPAYWNYLRIHDGQGAGQVARIRSITADAQGKACIHVQSVWNTGSTVMPVLSAPTQPHLGQYLLRNTLTEESTSWFTPLPTAGAKFVLVHDTLIFGTSPAIITVQEVLADAELRKVNLGTGTSYQHVQERIDLAKSILVSVTPIDYRELPVLFVGATPSQSGSLSATAFTPDLANSQPAGSKLLIPQPSGPFSVGINIFASATITTLTSNDTYSADDIAFVDDWSYPLQSRRDSLRHGRAARFLNE